MTGYAPAVPDADRPSARGLAALAVASALVVFASVQVVAWLRMSGFEYPLDDVYIHLAVAEQIARGHYGVNAAELSSPASSALYPLLLVPFAETEVQRYLPLMWNVLGLVASAGLFGRILAQSGMRPAFAVALAVAAPVALNLVGLAAVGMEHSLHAAASLAIVSGMIDHLRTGRLPPLLLIGLVLAPALRPEGLALGLLAAAVVGLRGRLLAGVLLGGLTILPQAAFVGFLLANGLAPLPSSVLTKLGEGASVSGLSGLRFNLEQPIGVLLALVSGLAGLAALACALSARRDAAWIAGMACLAAVAHLTFGQLGWLNRYEPYAFAIAFAGIFYALPALPRLSGALIGGAGGLLFLGAFAYYGYTGALRLPTSPEAIAAQQKQMSRFAKEYLAEPIAVNDLGYVAWRNPDYVLDLWGLASAEARALRLSGPPDRWADPLVKRANVSVVMIYDRWLGRSVGEDWVRLGTLDYITPDVRVALGDLSVDFYVVDPNRVGEVRALIADWADGLPPAAAFRWEEPPE